MNISTSQYILAFNKVTKKSFVTKGTPGWSWPRLASLDGELRPTFLKLMRKQLCLDLEHYGNTTQLVSDSTVGSDLPEVDSEVCPGHAAHARGCFHSAMPFSPPINRLVRLSSTTYRPLIDAPSGPPSSDRFVRFVLLESSTPS